MPAITNLILLLQPNQTSSYESDLDNLTPYSLERLHDIRLVRTSEAAGDENLIRLASHRSDPLLMGSRIPRILRPGSGQQNRFRRKRRSFQSDAAENHPGGDFTDSIHSTCHCNVQGTEPSMESFRGIFLPYHGSFLRFSEIIAFFRKKVAEKFGSNKKMRTFAIPNDKNSITVGSYNG